MKLQTGCGVRAALLTTLRARIADRSRVLAHSLRVHGRRSVLRICVTEAAVPTQGCHALLNGRKPTILAAEAGVVCAPRIILRLRPRADPSCYNDNCQHESRSSAAPTAVVGGTPTNSDRCSIPATAREFGLQFHFMFFGTHTDRRWPCVESPLELSPRSSATQIHE